MTTLEITIRLTESEAAAIDRAAQLERLTREEILRLAAREYIRCHQRRRDNPQIRHAMETIDAIAARLRHNPTDSTATVRYWRDARR